VIVASNVGTRASFEWEEIRVPGENSRARVGNNFTYPQTRPGIESGSHFVRS